MNSPRDNLQSINPPMPDGTTHPAARPPTDYRRMRRHTDCQMLRLVLSGLLIISGGLVF